MSEENPVYFAVEIFVVLNKKKLETAVLRNTYVWRKKNIKLLVFVQPFYPYS